MNTREQIEDCGRSSSRSVALCIEGSEAEFHGLLDEARRCFRAAWVGATDNRDRCVAAHYLGHLEDDPAVAHEWNLASMRFAILSDPNTVEAFMPSLLVNLGRTYELTGNKVEAAHFYAQARHFGLEHSTVMLDSTTSLRVLSIPRDDPLTSNDP